MNTSKGAVFRVWPGHGRIISAVLGLLFAQFTAKGLSDGRLSLVETSIGVKLRCGFQQIDADVTREGIWLLSTSEDSTTDKFCIKAVEIGRSVSDSDLPSSGDNQSFSLSLPSTGDVVLDDGVVRFMRPGLVEEYSVSMDGVRQDFVIASKPANTGTRGDLVLKLMVSGARVERAAYGAELVLDQSSRKIAYSRLKVIDADGKVLPSVMRVSSDNTGGRLITISVGDADAIYPIRIDPTLSDANWVSMGGINGADTAVRAMAVDGFGNVYVGGDFISVGNAVARGIARWNGTSWENLGKGFNSSVLAIGILGTDVYVGGGFTYVTNSDSTPILVNRIAKWNGSSWSALGTGIGGVVNALAVSGSDLFVAGNFTTAGVTPANNIAKWNGTAWSALGSGMGGGFPVVNSLTVSGSDVYAGGWFTTAGGIPASKIAKWNGSTWSALAGGMDDAVNALAFFGTDLYAGGVFMRATNSGGASVSSIGIAKWNGTSWSAVGGGASSSVSALVGFGGSIYAGGAFSFVTNSGGVTVSASRMARWNGSSWSSVGAGVNNAVYALVGSGSDLFAGGSFTVAGGVGANYIAKWNGVNWSNLWTGINSLVYSTAVAGSNIYIGGEFTTAGGLNATRIAKYNGSAWSTLGSGMNSNVTALAVIGADLYAGGLFTSAGGVSVNRIAKWNGSSWSTLGSGVTGGDGIFPPQVYALTVSGSNVYAGGNFTTAGGLGANWIARWNGSSWSAVGSGMNGPVVALLAIGSDIYAGGTFTVAGGSPASKIAKWNGSSWSTLGTGLNNNVYTIASAGTDVFIAGQFTTAGGMPANRIARWNGSSWSALDAGSFSTVRSLAVVGGRLFAGGSGISQKQVMMRDGNDWLPLGSGIGDAEVVNSLASSGDALYVGGHFIIAGQKVSPYFAKFSPLMFKSNSLAISNGNFHLLLTGPDTNNVAIDVTTNFTSWTQVVTNMFPAGGVMQLSIPSVSNTHQFYRARLLP